MTVRRSVMAWAAALSAIGATAAEAPSSDPVMRPDVVSTSAAEVRIAFRPDGRQIAWGSIGREAAADQQDVWEMHRVGTGWSRPARAAFDTASVEFDPAFSDDGRRLFFDSDRPGGIGGTDIYVVDVDAATGRFSTPRNLGPQVTRARDEWAPTPTPRGTLIFASNGWGGAGRHDLFEVRLDQPNGRPRNLGPAINSPDEDFDAVLTPDGNRLVFSSGTMSDTGAHVRLFTSRYVGGQWSRREPMPVGCTDFLIGAATARDRPHALYYAANCPGGRGRMDIRVARLPG